MKRMHFAATLPPQATTHSPVDVSHELDRTNEDDFKHSLFVPLHYEKKYAYPLLIWLHGAGDNERQLKRVMPAVSLRNYLAIAPRGTSADVETSGPAHCWHQTDADIVEAQWRLTSCIETVQARYNVHPDRVFLGGYADGGTMALRLALRMPQLCAGVFSIGGALPQADSPLLNVQRARGLSMMLMHGNQSKDYCTAQICDDLRVLHAAGMSVAVRQYPATDELTTKMLADVNAWMMERVTGLASQESQPACDLGELN